MEIERRFLVRGANWPQPYRSAKVRQVYLNQREDLSVRVRSMDGAYWLTLKAGVSSGTRQEFEWPIPAEDGAAILERLAAYPPIEKTRHYVKDAGRVWEVDVFEGRNAGLIIAETELHAINEPLALPGWLGPEVTDDKRLSNNALYRHSFADWGMTYAELVAELDQK
ncbi:CYTH domain-containing protein [Pedomonas mirosovicensis]|uniref:CYTH domain-containing protein n=1 Tax=Pedomonas mirosovicensis TaxID=2908641 RepID=UPI002167A09D|nr:CYTH domain-containing protein [Pedomonas mirosovicensis]MCH8685137.1 CYTH domain-containing protein [Pedomonas mirosovicensis]